MPETETICRPTKCKQCDRPMPMPIFCDQCRMLYPVPQSADHFALFGLPRQFDLDETRLRESFISISRNIHPDYFGDASPEMRRLALRLSAQVNEAYAVLKDPVLRAEYLLETAGGKSVAEDKRVPPELLGEVVALREQIEEARQAGDGARLDELGKQVRLRSGRTMARVSELARAVAGGSVSEQLDELRMQLNAMKYLRNLCSQLAP